MRSAKRIASTRSSPSIRVGNSHSSTGPDSSQQRLSGSGRIGSAPAAERYRQSERGEKPSTAVRGARQATTFPSLSRPASVLMGGQGCG